MKFLAFLGVTAVTQLVEVSVGIKTVLCDLDLCNGNIAAVVAHALIVGQQVIQNKAILDGAVAGLQAGGPGA